jgi:hypothetical protein
VGRDYLVYGGRCREHSGVHASVCDRTQGLGFRSSDLATLGKPVFVGSLQSQERVELMARLGVMLTASLGLLVIFLLRRRGPRQIAS